jgi:hypothetical protein
LREEAKLENLRNLVSTVKGVVDAIDLALRKEVSPARKLAIQTINLLANPLFYVSVFVIFVITAIVFYKLGEYRTYKTVYLRRKYE